MTRRPHHLALAFVLPLVIVAAIACSQPPATPSAAPASAKVTEAPKVAEPTKAPEPTSTAVPTKAPEPTAAPTATKAPATVAKPTDTPAPKAAVDLPSLIGVAQKNDSYSFESTMTLPASSTQKEIKSKGYVRGKEFFRSDGEIGGMQSTMIVDLTTNTAWMITTVGGQKSAMKTDLSGLVESNKQGESPTALFDTLASAKPAGLDTVDGKPAAVFERKDDSLKTTTKSWIWIERGVPLKVEVTGPDSAVTTIMYSNYQFGSQPDDLFKVPADATILDIGALPSVLTPGVNTPVPTKK